MNYWGDLRAPSDVAVPGAGGRGFRRDLIPVGSLAIRWESAALVRDILARIESKEYEDALQRLSEDYYVVAVVRMPRGGSQVWQTKLSGHWSPEQEEELRNARALQPLRRGLSDPGQPIPVLIGNEHAADVFSGSRLLRPGYEAILPARVESGKNAVGTVDLVMFPRSLELEKVTGDLDFVTTIRLGMGRAPFTARFSLKALAEGFARGL